MTKPEPSEYHSFYNNYIQLVPAGDFLEVLRENASVITSFFEAIPNDKHDFSYAPGKWTVKQLLLHMIDTERVMSYRALTVSRGDLLTKLPSFDENLFAENAIASGRSVENLLQEFLTVRDSSIFLFENMSGEESTLQGKVSDNVITPRALGYIIVGHALHHLNVLKERYLSTH